MCTLTIVANNEQLIVTMNRDESRQRDEAGHIQQVNHETTHAYFPVDQRSAGTWFGFNDAGLVLGLLNRYHEQQYSPAPSRGQIIPHLLSCHDLDHCKKQLSELTTQRFNPFDLVAVDGKRLINWRWNGQELSQHTQKLPHSMMFSSSSVDTDYVLAKRSELFVDFIDGLKTLPDGTDTSIHLLNDLHRQQFNDDLSSSIFMSRDATHTKSISQVVIGNHQLDYYYFEEHNLNNIHDFLDHQQCQHTRLSLPC